MKKPELTPEAIQHKQQTRAMRILCNRISSAFNFKTVKTWKDVYGMQGMSDEDMRNTPHGICLAEEPTYVQLKEHLNKLLSNLENKVLVPRPVIAEIPKIIETVKEGANSNYGFVQSPNESKDFFPYWFQKKAIVSLVEGILVHGKRGQLLLASTGLGKTFIAGGVIRRLVDVHFADNKTYGAVKYLYVTKSTIVEQTKRVFDTYFNLGIKDAVEVLNIEQLRSRAGAIWVNEKMQVIDGEESWSWTWRKMLNPVVLVLDECQGVKNEGSTQSKIIQSFADIPNNTYSIFVSATPFTRVVEAKAFILNCHYTDPDLF